MDVDSNTGKRVGDGKQKSKKKNQTVVGSSDTVLVRFSTLTLSASLMSLSLYTERKRERKLAGHHEWNVYSHLYRASESEDRIDVKPAAS